MREILVDDARNKRRLKRGGGQTVRSLRCDVAATEHDSVDVLALDEALKHLEREAPRQAEVVLLRYFAGLSVPEAAKMLGISPRTVDNDWRVARAWLFRELNK